MNGCTRNQDVNDVVKYREAKPIAIAKLLDDILQRLLGISELLTGHGAGAIQNKGEIQDRAGCISSDFGGTDCCEDIEGDVAIAS